MSTKLLFVFGFLIILGGGLLIFNQTKQTNQPEESSIINDQTAHIMLYKEKGGVRYKENNASSYTSLDEDKKEISNYTFVTTDSTGRAHVVFPDNSVISVGTGTEILIDYKPKHTSILQLIGTTYHRISSLAKGDQYEIKTPNTLAAVRGTKFAVQYYPKSKKTSIAVTESTVEVTPFDKDLNNKKSPTLVQKGRAADITTVASSSPTSSTTVTMATGAQEDFPSLLPTIQEETLIDTLYDKAGKEGRKEAVETMMEILKNSQTDDTSNTPRVKIIEKMLKIIENKQAAPPVVKTEIKSPVTPKTTDVPIKTAPPLTEQDTQETQEVVTLKTIDTSKNTFTREEQAYLDSFYDVYEKLFYVQDVTTYCQIISGVTPEQMLARLVTFATKEGYVLPKKDALLTFAKDLTASCQTNVLRQNMESLQTKFDSVYPY